MFVLLRWRVGGPYIDSHEEDDRIKDKKADSEPARMSSRDNKGNFFKCNMSNSISALLLCFIYYENHNIAIAMSSSCADSVLGWNILQG